MGGLLDGGSPFITETIGGAALVRNVRVAHGYQFETRRPVFHRSEGPVPTEGN